jgi:hypothetical protein
MKRWFATIAAVLFCSAALRADVTIVQTTTVEGGMAAMAAQAGAGASLSPKITTRVKGTKSRTDVEAGPLNISTIVDLDARQIVLLRADQKTATIVTVPAATAGDAAAPPSITGPTVEASIKPTGKTQTIDGVKCDEFAFNTSMDMSSMGGAKMPPEAVAAMQGMKMVMNGSLWVAKDAPGAEEFVAFQKTLSASNMAAAATGATGMAIPGMDKMAKAMGNVTGLTYLSDMTMTVEGTGQMADMMRQMGPMKIMVKVNSVSTTAVGDDAFKIPEGYTVSKQ